MSMRAAAVGVGSPRRRFASAPEFVPAGHVPTASTASIADAAFDAHAHICGWGPNECEVCRMHGERRISRRLVRVSL
jgi:hypothetical protein